MGSGRVYELGLEPGGKDDSKVKKNKAYGTRRSQWLVGEASPKPKLRWLGRPPLNQSLDGWGGLPYPKA